MRHIWGVRMLRRTAWVALALLVVSGGAYANDEAGASPELGASGIRVGPPAAFTPYDTAESIQWAFDFFVAPQRARDRQVMYSYDILKMTDEQINNAINEALKKKSKIAFVDVSRQSSLASVGESEAYYGLPVAKMDSEDSGKWADILRSFSGGSDTQVRLAFSDPIPEYQGSPFIAPKSAWEAGEFAEFAPGRSAFGLR